MCRHTPPCCTHVPAYAAVLYRSLYDGIDLRVSDHDTALRLRRVTLDWRGRSTP